MEPRRDLNQRRRHMVLIMTHKDETFMKKFIAFMLCLLLSAGTAFAIIDKYTIDRKDLPQEAQQMLTDYFPKTKVGMIKVDRHLLKKTDYDVRLVNGTTIEFNSKGAWTSVDCKTRGVPEGLVKKSIRTYITKNYPDTKIVKIVKKTSVTEIGLSDGVLLEFNLLGQFKKVKALESD